MLAIINGRVVTPRAVLDGHCVVIENHTIQKIAPQAQTLWPDDAQVLDAKGGYVVPGFIDLHVHGALGYDVMDGTVESLAQIAKFHLSGGTTAFTPTTMSDTNARISAALDAIAQARGHDFGGAQVLGAHLEGPYLAPSKCGAQPVSALRNPDPAEYLPWLDREGLVTQMTLAPELPGALELVDALLERESLPSGGHTAATGAQTRAAIDRGMCQATHLYNAMSAATKSGALRLPGAVETFLTDERTMVELIADGKHVHPTLLKLAVQAKGIDRVCLVTDATPGAGLPAGTAFNVGTTPGIVGAGVGTSPDGSFLVGSVITMAQAVRTMVEDVGFALPEAIRMASTNPARALSISGRKGSLEPRKEADVVVLSDTFTVRLTIVGGRVEYAAD
jgi:N-acetylglucosamine-6-phosphate deacetylase